MGGTALERCKVCGTTARYIMDNGDVYCTAHVPDPLTPAAGCKVFSATRAWDREHLGEVVTEWLRVNNVESVDTWVVQSSDAAFHCISMVVFFRSHA